MIYPEIFICRQILEVLARVRDEEEEYLCNQIYKNTMKLFFPYEL
jgi:Tat protein secretion system quality control protein TatD with DNase activity